MIEARGVRRVEARRGVRPFALACAALSACLAAGCSTNELVDPLASAGLRAPSGWQPRSLKLALAPVEDARGGASATATADRASGEAAAETVSPVPGFSRAELRAEIANALARASVFEAVAPIDPPPSGEPRASPDARDEGLLAKAYALGDDLVLELRLRRYELAYLGTDTYPGRNFFSIFACLNWYFPTFWVADEDYACELELEATLLAVGSERTVFSRKLYRSRVVRTLDDFERGVSPLGPFWVRAMLDEDNWRKVAEVVAPPARAEVEEALVKDLRALDPAAPELASGLLVAVGAGHFEPGKVAKKLLSAEEDAKGFHDMLVRGGVLPEKNASLLLSGGATRDPILAAVRRAAQRARATDTLYVFFAGFGTASGGVPLLVPADFDPARPLDTGIPLPALIRVLDSSPCHQVIVLDASFGGGESRGVRTLAGAAGKRGDDALLIESFRSALRPGRAIILAAGPSGEARSTDEGGNFSAFLLEAAKSAEARTDDSGHVTLDAIFAKVREDTMTRFDPPQEPVWLGAGSRPSEKAFRVPLLRKSAWEKRGRGVAGSGK